MLFVLTTPPNLAFLTLVFVFLFVSCKNLKRLIVAINRKEKPKKKGKGMKGMSIKSGDKRPTKQGAGLTAKGVAKYRRQNPGSKLQTAVTEKNPKGKRAARRKSFCARSAGQMKKFPKAAKDPNSRLRQARKRWRC